MSTQTGSISFESTGNFSQVVKQNYATLSQIKGQFAVCSTGASTTEKIATTVPTNTDWTLYAGATVTVKFTSANTASVPTLNVNGTGPKEIRDYNANELLKAAREWPEGAAMALTYDGTYWRIQDSNLMERVHTAETGIEQNATNIALKANASDVYTKTSVDGFISKEVTDRNAAITAASNAINLSVSENYTSKTEFENLEIGGRNLLPQTFNFSLVNPNTTYFSKLDEEGINGSTILRYIGETNTSSNRVFAGINDSYIRNVTIPDTLTEEVSFTLSAYVRMTGGANNDSSIFVRFRTSSTSVDINIPLPRTFDNDWNDWKKVSTSMNIVAGEYTNIAFNLGGRGMATIDICLPKLEKGSKATDWTPAPEDVEAYTDEQVSSAKSEIKVTTDGINSEVSKINSVKYVNTSYSTTLATLKGWAKEGINAGNWNHASDDSIRVGDTVYFKCHDTTRDCDIFIKVKITSVASATQCQGISHGYEDVLPIETIKSTINQSSDSVKIAANHVDIEGAAIFSSGSLSKVVTSTQNQWYSSTSATTKANGSWGTTQPTVTAGRYIWERQYITYSNGDTEYKPSEAGICTQAQTDLSSYSTTSQMNSAIGNAKSEVVYDVDDGYGVLMPFSRRMNLGTVNQSTGTWRLAGNSQMTRTRELISDGPYGVCYCLQNAGTQTNATDASCYGMDSFNLGDQWDSSKIYIASMYARVVDGSGMAGFCFYNANYLEGSHDTTWGLYQMTTLNSNWTKIWITFTRPNKSANFYIGAAGADTTTAATVQMCMFRIEEFSGNYGDIQTNLDNLSNALGGFDILWNRAEFANDTNAGGECYLCALDPLTNQRSDANGWAMWNGVKRTITKGMFNPNTILPYNIPIYIVYRLSSATATTGTNYMVWYNSGWKYAAMAPSAVSGTWTWVEATDMVLGKFVEPGSEVAFTECETYNPPLKWGAITTDTTTAHSAQSTANNAAPKSSAVSRTQRIYYRTNTALSSSITGPTTWIGESGNKYNTTAPTTAIIGWSTKPTPLAASTAADATKYLYLYTCTQTQTVSQAANNGTTCTASTVLLDDTETIIDGGNIITGTVTANAIKADSGTFNTANIPNLNAAKITSGDIVADRIKTNVVNAINATVNKIDAKNINVNAINIGDLSGTVGGKNLALDSDQPYNWQKYTPTTYEIAQIKMTEDFIPGETYTVTIWGGPITRSDKSSCWYALYWGGGNFSLANTTLIETGIYRATFTISTTNTAQHTAVGNNILDIYNTPAVGASGTTYSAPITKIQIEKGNISTKWEPAQEELPRPNLYKTTTTMAYIVGSGSSASGTITAHDDSYHGRTLTVTTAGGTLRISNIISKTNIPYTVSFILTASVATTISVDIMDNTVQTITVPKGTSKVIFTSTPTRAVDSTYHFIDMVFNTAGTYKMENIKVEMGTVATTWIAAEQISNYIHADSTGINIYDNRLSNANKYYLRQTAGGTYIYRNTYLKAKYEDTITLYGGSSTSGANPKMTLNSTTLAFTDANGKTRFQIVGGSATGNGLYVYDSNQVSIAEFGSNLRIGKINNDHIMINSNSLQAFDNNGNKYFEVTPTSLSYGPSLANSVATIDYVDNVEIGGRNLLGYSGTYEKWGRTDTSKVNFIGNEIDINVANDGKNHFYRPYGWLTEENLVSGTITISFEVYCDNWAEVGSPDSSNTGFQYTVMQICYRDTEPWTGSLGTTKRYKYIALNNTSYWKILPNQTNSKWLKFVSRPLTLPDDFNNDASNGTGKYITVEPMLRGWGHVKFRNIKVEKGDKATDWTPAPEDQTAYVDSSISAQTSVRFRLIRNNWTDTQWATYETIGRSDSWANYHVQTAGSSTSSPTGFDGTTLKIGDLLVIEGISTNTKSIHSMTVKVTAIPTTATGAIAATTIAITNSTELAANVTSAAKTATNYMSFDSTNGLIIAQSSPSTTAYPLVQITPSSGILIKQSATSYSKITSSGMEIYVPVSSTATKVASFGTTATIGQTSTGRVEVTSTGVGLYNKNNKMKVSIGTGNSIFYGGEATYPYIEVSNSSTGAINIKQSATSYTSITSSGMDIYTTVSSAAKNVAHFGTTARIGADGASRFLINSDSLQAYSGTATSPYFQVSSSGLSWGSNTAATTAQVTTVDEKVNYYNRRALVRQSTTLNADKPWYKFASCSITTQNTDRLIKFDVISDSYGTTKQGTLIAHIRVGSGIKSIDYKDFSWLDRNSAIDRNKFVMAYKLNSGTSLLCELWCKLDELGWHGLVFDQIYENGTKDNPSWTLYETSTAGSQASITSGYTQVVSTDASNAYITNIDSNKGITIKPSDSSGNDYLQMNSSDIRFVRNNVDVMNLTDSTFRLGTASGKHATIDTNGLHIWTGAESTATNEIASFGSTARIGPTNNSRFEINSNNLKAYSGTATSPYFEVSSSTLKWGSYTAATTTAVTNAGKTASDYITPVTSGIMIHLSGDSTTGVKITDKIQIMKSNKVLNQIDTSGNHLYAYDSNNNQKQVASFIVDSYGQSVIYLGLDGDNSIINLCNNTGKITKSSGALKIESDSTLSIVTNNSSKNTTSGITIGESSLGTRLYISAPDSNITLNEGYNATNVCIYSKNVISFATGSNPLDGLSEPNSSQIMLYKAMPTGNNANGSYPNAGYPAIILRTPTSHLGNILVKSNSTSGVNACIGIAPVSLYDNDSHAFSGSIELSETAANFTRLEIYGKDNDSSYCYTQIWNPNNKTFAITQTLSYGGNFYIKSRTFTITNKIIDTKSTSSTYHTGEVNAAGSNNGSNSDVIKIVKVLGYR